MSEGTLQAKMIVAARQRGAYVVKVHQAGRGTKGVPDLLICHHGYFLAVEAKNPNGKGRPTDHQLRQLHAVADAGGVAMLCQSMEHFNELLDLMEDQAPCHGTTNAPQAKIVQLVATAAA